MEKEQIVEIYNRYIKTTSNNFENNLAAMLKKLSYWKDTDNTTPTEEKITWFNLLYNASLQHAVYVLSKNKDLQINKMFGDWNRDTYRLLSSNIYKTAKRWIIDSKATASDVREIADAITKLESLSIRLLTQRLYFETFTSDMCSDAAPIK